MKILAGVPKKTHSEISNLEINALQNSGVEVHTSIYGNTEKYKGLIASAVLVLRNAISLTRKAFKNKYDIIYLNTAFDKKTIVRDSVTTWLIKLFNKKVRIVLKLHGSEKSWVLSETKLKKYLLKKINLILVLSSEERNNFLQSGVNPEKVKITANAINKNNYITDFDFKKKSRIDSDCAVLLFIGRLIKEKGILDLIESCRIMKENNLKFVLLCIGEGPLKTKLAELIEKYKLNDEVRLLGFIEESKTKYYYSNCDILILPTYHAEGFPMAVFQAVAAGKSIITTQIRAAADYFIEYQNCLWVKEKDPNDLFSKIQILYNEPFLRQKISNNNIHLAENFTPEAICEKITHYFEEVIGSR